MKKIFSTKITISQNDNFINADLPAYAFSARGLQGPGPGPKLVPGPAGRLEVIFPTGRAGLANEG